MKKVILLVCLFAGITACKGSSRTTETLQEAGLVMGAEQPDVYLPLLKGKKVAILCNHTATAGTEHLVDKLVAEGIDIRYIFAPEHGFRGDADAGAVIKDGVDPNTGIKVVSVYGGEKDVRPADSLMQQVDVALFDIQDVGTRFYTYLSSMYYLMDACAVNSVPLIVLDRPNPNGHYVDGPLLDIQYRSFVGIVPVPVVHGMTFGELAGMINGKNWLMWGKENEGVRTCDLTVVPVKNYTHATLYQVPVAPSPNLPSARSIYLYPSLCYFEGTVMSMGRGTDFPFEVFGHPAMKGYEFSFTPHTNDGNKNPVLKDQLCYGVDLRTEPSDEQVFENGVNLEYVIEAYRNLGMGDRFFRGSFERLIGVSYARKMIIEGKNATDIKEMWKDDVENFIRDRKPYLLYADTY